MEGKIFSSRRGGRLGRERRMGVVVLVRAEAEVAVMTEVVGKWWR